jgi:DNA polymerase delta subunit 3
MSELMNRDLFPAYILRMLYEFHRQQNGKKPGSVHATYLISGCRRRQEPTFSRKGLVKDGDDEYMQSSPFRSSPVQQIDEVVEESPVLSITLVKEEDLTGTFDDLNARYSKLIYPEVQSSYESITSIHVYSLAPGSIKVS